MNKRHLHLKETKFIKEKQEKWKRFENLYAKKEKDPQLLTDLFIDITNDLSYAKTNYEKRSVRVYLNQLAQKVFSAFYLKKKNKAGFFTFWKKTLPLEMYRARWNMFISFAVFIIAALIGIISQEYNPDFFRIIAGDTYVDQTIDNINNGDPLAIYGTNGTAYTFFYILYNNLRVVTISFATGIFLSLGTYFCMLYNGIMVGSFQWFFKTQGVLLTAFLGIWIHGAFEISAIIISGGAGITLGNGILFPGTRSRKESLIQSGVRGLRIILGVFVLILFAAFFEGYLTRHYESIDATFKLIFILLCFTGVIGYFFIYPFFVARKHESEVLYDEGVPEMKEPQEKQYQIRSLSKIYEKSFMNYGKIFRSYGKIVLMFCLPIVMLSLYTLYSNHGFYFNADLYWYENIAAVFSTHRFINIESWIYIFITVLIATSAVGYSFTQTKAFSLMDFGKYFLKKAIPLIITLSFIYLIFSFTNFVMFAISLFILPFFMGGIAGLLVDPNDALKGFIDGIKVSVKGYLNYLTTLGMLILVTFVFFQILSGIGFGAVELPDLLDSLIVKLVEIHTSTYIDDYWIVIQFIKSIFYIAFLLFMIPLWCLTLFYVLFSETEKIKAFGLNQEVQKFGKRSDYYEQPIDYE